MRKATIAAVLTGIALGLIGCGEETAPVQPVPTSGQPVAANLSPFATDRPDRNRTPESSTVEVSDRGDLLGRLPQSALLAVRVPSIASLRSGVQALPVYDLWKGEAFADLRSTIMSQVSNGIEQVLSTVPKEIQLTEVLDAVQGECVFSLVELHPWLMSGIEDQAFFTMAFYLQVGEARDQVQASLERAFKHVGGTTETHGDHTALRYSDSKGTLVSFMDGSGDDAVLCMFIAPSGVSAERFVSWQDQQSYKSLLATDVVDLRTTANVQGRIVSTRLILHEGGTFHGEVRPQRVSAALTVARHRRSSHRK